jgi:hypothetical protein
MGRPLNKRYFGATEDGDGDLSSEGTLSVIVKVGSNSVSELGVILSQRSETKFKVSDDAQGDIEGANTGVCTLVDKDVPAADEMVLKGYVAGSGDGVNIRKVQNRTMIDFNNNRYTWAIQDDSTANILVLTAI